MIRTPVLLYHRIDDDHEPTRMPYCVNPANFALQMQWLAQNGYNTVSLLQMYNYYQGKGPIPDKPVVITFDDGFYCNYSRAFPEMKKYGFTGTIFLISGSIRNNGNVNEGNNSFMSWDEVRKMKSEGWEFGSHTVTHPDLNTVSDEEVLKEAIGSKEKIGMETGDVPQFFCYPYDRYGKETQAVIHSAGYLGACGGNGYPFGSSGPVNWYEIGRTEIFYSETFRQFTFKVKTGYSPSELWRVPIRKIKKAIF